MVLPSTTSASLPLHWLPPPTRGCAGCLEACHTEPFTSKFRQQIRVPLIGGMPYLCDGGTAFPPSQSVGFRVWNLTISKAMYCAHAERLSCRFFLFCGLGMGAVMQSVVACAGHRGSGSRVTSGLERAAKVVTPRGGPSGGPSRHGGAVARKKMR